MGDVFKIRLADISELGVDLAAHLTECVFGDEMPPGSAILSSRAAIFTPSPWMSPSSTMNVAEVDANPEGDPLLFRCRGIALDRRPLHGERAGDGLDHARELDQEAVAGRLDETAMMLCDLGIDQFAAMRFEPRERAFLVLAHQPAVARVIGREDRRQPALDTLPLHLGPPWRALQLAPMSSADQ